MRKYLKFYQAVLNLAFDLIYLLQVVLCGSFLFHISSPYLHLLNLCSIVGRCSNTLALSQNTAWSGHQTVTGLTCLKITIRIHKCVT